MHGQELCKKFKDNKCDFGVRCFYKHIINPAQVVTPNFQVPPPQYTQQVFPNLPATGQQTLMVGDQKMYKMMNQMMSEMMKQMNLKCLALEDSYLCGWRYVFVWSNTFISVH